MEQNKEAVKQRCPWIVDYGSCSEKELLALMKEKAPSQGRLLAFSAGAFQAADLSIRPDAAELLFSNAKGLLEIRCFNSSRELWAHRSGICADFQWRIAEESGVPERYVIRTLQLLDIDMVSENRDAFGCREVRSTVKGHFELPIQEDDCCAEVVQYVSYRRYNEKSPSPSMADKMTDGTAGIIDYRLAGFADMATGREWVGAKGGGKSVE